MTNEDDQGGAGAAEAFEAMRGELALLRRAVEAPVHYRDTDSR